MPQPLIQYTKPKPNSDEGKRLTIRNYGKIKGLCYYDDGKWEPLHATHIKAGGRAYIEWIEERERDYTIRLLYILPQPEAALVTISRNSISVNNSPMWRVEMDKGSKRLVSEYWEGEEFEMKRLLEAIKVWLID